MIKLLAPQHPTNPITKIDKQKFSHLFSKSAQTSPLHSPQKEDKIKNSAFFIDNFPDKKLKKYPSRSLSQTIRKMYPQQTDEPREDSIQRQMQQELRGTEPIKAMSTYIKHLNQKIAKETKPKKHIKKRSGILPKFA